MKALFIFISLIVSQNSWCFDYLRPALRSMSNTTSSINQLSQSTDDEGHQDKQWDQEEEDAQLTDQEKQQMQEDKEIFEQKEESIQDYRYDVPRKRKEN